MHNFKTRFMSGDMLTVTGVAVPREFKLAKGARIEIEFPTGRRGTLEMTSQTKARWSLHGSLYDGHDFDVVPRFTTEGPLEVALVQLAA